jgi:uncharacterized protein HemX
MTYPPGADSQSTLPQMPVPNAAEPQRSSPATVIFLVAAIVLLLSTGAMTALFLMKNNDASRLNDKLKARDAAIAHNTQQVNDLQKQLDDAKHSGESAQQKLAVYETCIKAMRELALASANGGTVDPAKEQKTQEACVSAILGTS